ncbi:MAG: hypothetical protein ACJ71K_12090 [Nitrososphaeraceae archaeon]
MKKQIQIRSDDNKNNNSSKSQSDHILHTSIPTREKVIYMKLSYYQVYLYF